MLAPMNAQQDQYGNYTPVQQPQAPPIAGSITMVINGSGNPSGVVTSLPDTLYFDNTGLVFYFSTDGTTWTALSGGGGSAVTQILAGTNITVSPAGGTGAVTVNSSGGSAQVFSGNYAGIAPTFTPTTSVAIAIDTSNGTQWSYYSGAWH